ncbi:inositol 1,4,5-triphosphate receptor associated 2-like [Callorhinchus milii]|uniref:inositol 1,4,5-triphosphate receptor associated 2-like n=1 Tax=Callorhinchus milii TaxID=7868 RepID=UPI001C3FD362|nr:inositol 1,4,5-triphosphate receptor associated 2-like [Callorhinchus milii]
MNSVADLQFAKQKLTEQNRSLQKAMEMSDEANLQLTEELAKLKNQLTSSHQTLRSIRSMAEELEDVKSTAREAQEKAYHLQTCCKELKKENETLVAKMCLLCEENEKAMRGKRQLKYRVDELLTVNAELTKQIHEAQSLLISKDALIFEKTILNEELKVSISESSRVIEGLRTELRGHEERFVKISLRKSDSSCNAKKHNSALSSFVKCKIGLGKPSAGISNVFPAWPRSSLQSEIQAVQIESVEGLSSPVCGLLLSEEQEDLFQQALSHIKIERNSTLFQTTIEEMVNQLNVQAEAFMSSLQRVDSAYSGSEQPTAINLKELKKELKQLMLSVVQKLHRLSPIKESWDKTVGKLEQACLQCHQQYLNAKHNLTNMTKELELQKRLKVEVEDKAADAQRRAEEAKEVLRTSQDQQARKSMEDAKKVKDEAAISVIEETVKESGGIVAETKKESLHSECASLEARLKVGEAEKLARRMEESMAAAPEGPEGSAQPGDWADGAARPTAEAWWAGEEGRKEDGAPMEEMERVKEGARQNLLETSEKVIEMEHKDAGMERMVSSPYCTVSAGRGTVGATDESLLGKAASSESGKKTPAGNVGEGKQSVGSGPSLVVGTQGSTAKSVETLREEPSTTHKRDPPLATSSQQSEGNITDGRAEPRQQEGVGGERNDNSKVKVQKKKMHGNITGPPDFGSSNLWNHFSPLLLLS